MNSHIFFSVVVIERSVNTGPEDRLHMGKIHL